MLIESNADLFYTGKQKVNSFAYICRRRIKPLFGLIKQNYSAKAFKDFETKYKKMSDDFSDFSKTQQKEKKSSTTVSKNNEVKAIPVSKTFNDLSFPDVPKKDNIKKKMIKSINDLDHPKTEEISKREFFESMKSINSNIENIQNVD